MKYDDDNEGFLGETIRNLDVYPLVCSLLGIEASPNNGSLQRTQQFLKNPLDKIVEDSKSNEKNESDTEYEIESKGETKAGRDTESKEVEEVNELEMALAGATNSCGYSIGILLASLMFILIINTTL